MKNVAGRTANDAKPLKRRARPPVRNCEECRHLEWTNDRALKTGHTRINGICTLGVKIRFFGPRSPLDETFGYRRRCEMWEPRGRGGER